MRNQENSKKNVKSKMVFQHVLLCKDSSIFILLNWMAMVDTKIKSWHPYNGKNLAQTLHFKLEMRIGPLVSEKLPLSRLLFYFINKMTFEFDCTSQLTKIWLNTHFFQFWLDQARARPSKTFIPRGQALAINSGAEKIRPTSLVIHFSRSSNTTNNRSFECLEC